MILAMWTVTSLLGCNPVAFRAAQLELDSVVVARRVLNVNADPSTGRNQDLGEDRERRGGIAQDVCAGHHAVAQIVALTVSEPDIERPSGKSVNDCAPREVRIVGGGDGLVP